MCLLLCVHVYVVLVLQKRGPPGTFLSLQDGQGHTEPCEASDTRPFTDMNWNKHSNMFKSTPSHVKWKKNSNMFKSTTGHTKRNKQSSMFKSSSRYVHWNKLATTLSSRKPASSNNKYIVYQCIPYCGGFGDRLKGMTNAYLWSIVTERHLVFDLQHPCTDFLNGLLVPNKVNWNISYPKTTPVGWTIHLTWINVDRPGVIIEKGLLGTRYPNPVIILRSNIDYWESFVKHPEYRTSLVSAGFSDLSARGIFRKAFFDLFKWSPTLENLFLGIRNARKVGGAAVPLLCSQVRLGKMTRNDSQRRKITSVQEQFDYIKAIENRYSKANVFITTDSDSVRIAARRSFNSSYIETPGMITHSDYSESRAACEGMKKVVLDFMVLTRCDYLQVSRSGFGILASYLQKNLTNVSMTFRGKIIKGLIPNQFLNYVEKSVN